MKNLYQTKTFLHVLKTAFVETPSRHDYGQRRQLLCNTSHIGFSRKWSQVLGTSELRDEMRFGPSLGLLWCKDAVPWNVLGRLMFISITAITFFLQKWQRICEIGWSEILLNMFQKSCSITVLEQCPDFLFLGCAEMLLPRSLLFQPLTTLFANFFYLHSWNYA